MGAPKLVVTFPRLKDIETFEKIYQNVHAPMAVEKLTGKTKIVATKAVGSPQGTPPYYCIVEIHFPLVEALEKCDASEGGKEAVANAVSISSGGAPIFLAAEEETYNF